MERDKETFTLAAVRARGQARDETSGGRDWR